MLKGIHHKNNLLPQLIIDIAFLSLSTASPLERWTKASQIMLEKGKGRHINNLRIIQLCEADLNMVLHAIWGHRLIQHATTYSALNKSQYAIPGQTCNSAVLNKVLLFCDLSRQSLTPGILTDFDASAAFDRVIASLSIITCRRVGLPIIAGHFMFNLLKNMHFHLVTGFSRSEQSFKNTQNNTTGQGVLQGSSSAAPIFLLNSDVSLSTYNHIGIGATFTHPITREKVSNHGVQFVDDRSQFLNSTGAMNHSNITIPEPFSLAKIATNNAQAWSDCLWISGGQLYLNKCFYYAFQPVIDFKSNSTKCSKLSLDSDIKVKNTLDGSSHTFLGLSPNEARRSLGVMFSPDGDGATQIRVSTMKVKEYFGKFINGLLPQRRSKIDSLTSQMKCLALGFKKKSLEPFYMGLRY